MTVAVIAGDTIIGKGKVKIVPSTWQPTPLAQGIINFGNYLKNPKQIVHDIANIPAIQLPAELTGQPTSPKTVARSRIGSLPPEARQIMQYPEGVPTGLGGGNAGASIAAQIPAPASLIPTVRFNAGAGPNGPNPNAIVQGQDGIPDEYRQRLAAYNNQATLARQALQGYDPSKGPLPGAAQEAQAQGMDIWKDLYAGTKMAQPGGAVGTFNPLMQARGDVPSMAELWQGIGGGAPTAGPSQDAIKAAIARGVNQPGSGGFFVPPGSPSPVEQAQQQQLDTAAQAGSGTEASTAMQRTEDFIKNIKFGALNPNNYSLPSADYLKNYNWNTDFGSVFK